MITREEAEKMVEEIGDYFEEFHQSKALDVVEAIYDSIGTCNNCCLRGEQECAMVFYCDAFGWVDESEYDGYCHKFISKGG